MPGLPHLTTAFAALLVRFLRSDLQGFTGRLSRNDAIRVANAVGEVKPEEQVWAVILFCRLTGSGVLTVNQCTIAMVGCLSTVRLYVKVLWSTLRHVVACDVA